MGNHYIPKFYLSGFSTGAQIWVFDREKNACFKSQPKSVANETGMYPDQLENYLTEEIEQPANHVLQRVREFASLSDAHRNALAKYAIALWKRVPEGRRRALSLMPNLADEVGKNLHEKYDLLAGTDRGSIGYVEQRKKDIDRVIADYKKNPPLDVWHKTLEEHQSPRVLEAVLSMSWRLLRTTSSQFLTSDNPLFFFGDKGVGRHDSELSFPLSSEVALWANKGEYSGPLYVDATPAMTREINRRTASNATRFLFAAKNETWIQPFIAKRNYRLNRII